jgi:hypothetical protein
MQCKYHPDRPAEIFCASCNAPLCKECAEEAKPGQYYCFECAMLHSVSEVGTSMREKREKGEEKKEKKKWGPLHYFVIVCSVLILVMWGIIFFGGQKAPPREVDFAKKGRVLLFMVDGALKRYAHYEGNGYPERLSKLVPKYLSLRKEELFYLDRLLYQRDPKGGYSLSLARTKPGEMNIILSAKGIEYSRPPSSGGPE